MSDDTLSNLAFVMAVIAGALALGVLWMDVFAPAMLDWMAV